MPRNPWIPLAAAFVLALGAFGCNPKIGDSCSVSTDCSATGDRLCDTTEPGGYCTIFNCEPGTCPSEAVCVAFHTDPSPAQGCRDPQGTSRFERSFCMFNCSSDSDCRSGYSCIDVNKPGNPWGAVVVERGDFNGAVCIVPASGAVVPGDAAAGVCTGYDGGFDAPPSSSDAGDAGDASDASDASDEDALMSTDAADEDALMSVDAEAGSDATTDAAGD